MNATLTPFNYSDHEVRVVTDDHGEPWFVVADIARILGYRDAANAARLVEEDERGYSDLSTPGGTQKVLSVNESGVYALVFRSSRPDAVKFRRFVTATILPAIRKTGGYGVATIDPTDPAALAVFFDQAAATARALVAERAITAELAPKADLADTYLIAQGGNRKVREAAKLLAMRERDLRRFLIDERLIFARHARCGDVQYDFYAEFSHHFQAIEHVVNHTWGSCSHYTLTITPRGIDLIRRRMAKVALPADEAAAQLTSAGAR